MSTYNERYDEALSKAPWVSKMASNQRTLLFKYAPFPERKGYLFAATDLETVYFEAITGTSIPTRLAQVAAREEGQEASDAIVELGFEEQQRRTDESLKALSDAFDGGWATATIEAEADDYFDAVYFLRAGSFSWVFNMTEMRGRQPLSFIAKHLISPFSVLMAMDRGVDTPVSSARPVDAIAAVVSDSGVARALRRVTGAPPPASAKATPAPARSPAPSKAKSERASPLPPTPKPVLKRTPSPERTPLARPPTPPRASVSQALPPMIPASSPTPAAKKRVYDFAAGLMPSSGPASPLGTSGDNSEMPSSTNSPPAPAQRVLVAESTHRSPPPPSDPPSSSMIEPPTSTQDPLMPTLPKKKKKISKKELEAEEEAKADRRREELKRNLKAGGRRGLGRKR